MNIQEHDLTKFKDSVSVVIPAFNCRDTLDRALASIFAQVCYIKEVLVVDDGSTINFVDIIDRWVSYGLPILYFRLTVNSGPGYARNFGIKKSSGLFIAFLDADDYWHDNKIEIQLYFLLIYPEIEILGTLTSVMGPSSTLIKPSQCSIKQFGLVDFLISCRIPMRSVIIRRSVPILFGDRECVEDFYAWLNYLIQPKSKIYRVESTLSFSGMDEFSGGSYSSNLLSTEIREINTLLSFLTSRNRLAFLIPIALIFSVLKFFRRFISRFLKNLFAAVV